MPAVTYKVFKYLRVVRALFMLINLAIQIEWICFAQFTGAAAAFYFRIDGYPNPLFRVNNC